MSEGSDYQNAVAVLDDILDSKCPGGEEAEFKFRAYTEEKSSSEHIKLVYAAVNAVRQAGPISVIKSLFVRFRGFVDKYGLPTVVRAGIGVLSGNFRLEDTPSEDDCPYSAEPLSEPCSSFPGDVFVVVMNVSGDAEGCIRQLRSIGFNGKSTVINPSNPVSDNGCGIPNGGVWTGGLNTAIASSPVEKILVMKDACRAELKAVASLVGLLDRASAGMAGCNIIRSKDETVCCGGMLLKDGTMLSNDLSSQRFMLPGSTVEVDFINNGVIAFRKSVIESCGLFDSTFGSLNAALTDMSLRLRMRGFSQLVSPFPMLMCLGVDSDVSISESDASVLASRWRAFVSSNYRAMRPEEADELLARDRRNILVVIDSCDGLPVANSAEVLAIGPIARPSDPVLELIRRGGMRYTGVFSKKESGESWMKSNAILFDEIHLVGKKAGEYLASAKSNGNARILCYDDAEAFVEGRRVQ